MEPNLDYLELLQSSLSKRDKKSLKTTYSSTFNQLSQHEVPMLYHAGGLAEEAGEVAGAVKKYIRDRFETPEKLAEMDTKAVEKGYMSLMHKRRVEIGKEMADVLHNLLLLAEIMEIDLIGASNAKFNEVSDRREETKDFKL